MNTARIVIIAIALITLALSVRAQNYADIQQYSTPILLNPSFAGSTKGDRLTLSLISTRRKGTKSYLKFISHDFFIKKKSLGIGIIGGVHMDYSLDTTYSYQKDYQNVLSPFLEISGAKYIDKGRNRYLIPSITLGFRQPLKEYSLFLLDRFIKPGDNQSYSPGNSLIRVTELVAGAGILFSDYDGSVGVSAKIRRSFIKNTYTKDFDIQDYSILIHAQRIFTYYHRGLLSKAYLIRPKLVFHAAKESVQLFSELTVQRKEFETGIGFLPNFNTGNSRYSINLGYDFEYFKVNYLGSILNEQGEFTAPMHSIGIRVIFPELKRYGIPVPALIRNL